MKPKRIQLRRVKGFRLSSACDNPNGYAVVSRPTKWGNPLKVIPGSVGLTQAGVTQHFKILLEADNTRWAQWINTHIDELRGKDLACWCKPDDPCHADVLLEMANREELK